MSVKPFYNFAVFSALLAYLHLYALPQCETFRQKGLLRKRLFFISPMWLNTQTKYTNTGKSNFQSFYLFFENIRFLLYFPTQLYNSVAQYFRM